jgi:hypothetical protein
LGERKVFRAIVKHMAKHMQATVLKNMWAMPEFGRYDDLLVLLDSPIRQNAARFIKTQLNADIRALETDDTVSLLGKWLPSVNAHNSDTVRCGKILAKELGMTEAMYRRTLSKLRVRIAILENNLREKNYTFDYEKQPSQAMMKYRKAFFRNDGERYREYLERVTKGTAKMNTATLFPYDIIRPIVAAQEDYSFSSFCFSCTDLGYECTKCVSEHENSNNEMNADERKAIDATWNAQEDFTQGENALVVIDGSGSMYSGGNPQPAEVALSLGIYFAERNRGAFANHFITFSETPRMVQIKGNDIYEKVEYCKGFNEIANTNIKAVFDLILSAAIKQNIPQSELPSKIYIISDMEFDRCADNADTTNFAYAKSAFAEHGYTLPNVVFWNVDSRNRQQPVTMNEQGVILVSGSSPRVFSMIKSGKLSPISFMLDTLNSERYEKIQV